MAIDNPSETPRQSQQRIDRQKRSRSRQWVRGLLAISAIAVVATVAALLAVARGSREIGPRLAYTITRGDLIVTVTEQGRLESAENLAIKCKVRGQSTVIWIIENGTMVEPGDELVRLDTLVLENTIAERTKYAHWSRSAAERGRATVKTAELAISEYLDGRYHTELMNLETQLAIAESDLRTAKSMLAHDREMAQRGYVSVLDIEERKIAVAQAESSVGVKNTLITTLRDYTKKMQLETLYGNLLAAKANLAASEERARNDAARRDLALEELEYCTVRAEKSGLVIHPSSARWENAPEIAEGATVHKDQDLLLMPDLSQMQVTVNIRESRIDRIKPGLAARVALPDQTLHGEVDSVASVTSPAGWWSGNVVKYETIIKLPSEEGLRPGMSADVEVLASRHENVLTIPVAATVETDEGDFCWVQTTEGPKRRTLRLGDTNDVFTVVTAGLKEGDQVLLNPLTLEKSQPET